jgi:hypothetical protein
MYSAYTIMHMATGANTIPEICAALCEKWKRKEWK